ncbi:MAG: hypothetical protein IJF49_06880 [Clostridia bacterium]|nr:hypothetical protein [Clostridia bacterium]
MTFWYVLFGFMAIYLLFPYLRCFAKRVVCARSICRICRRKNFSLHPTHPFWFFGSKYGNRCDCYIETPTQVFALKLFGVPRRASVLTFEENGLYFIRRFAALVSFAGFANFTFDDRAKSLPVYNFRHQYQDIWETKTPRRILLVNPVSMEIRHKSRHGNERIVGAGDTVNGMEVYSLARLTGDLECAI